MYIFNTTFAIEPSLKIPFLAYLRETHLKRMIEFGFSEPRLFCLEAEQEFDSYALQLSISDRQILSNWQNSGEPALIQELFSLFGEQVLLFSTVMQVVDL